MEIKNNENLIDNLIINKIPSKNIFEQMLQQGKINDNELYLIQDDDINYYKNNFKVNQGQTAFTIPYTFKDNKTINAFYNGILMIENVNYEINNNTLQFIGFTGTADDNLTLIISNAAPMLDITDQLTNIQNGIQQIQQTKQDGINELNNIIQNGLQDIETNARNAVQKINNKIQEIPEDMSQVLYKTKKNTMAKNSRITMYNNYIPTNDMDIATKKYVDTNIPVTVTKTDKINIFTSTGKIIMDQSYEPTTDNDLIDKKYLDKQIKKAIPAFSNGPILIEEDTIFVPSDYGITIGDKIQVICIGGGGGGSDYAAGDAQQPSYIQGDYGCGGGGIDSTKNSYGYETGAGGGGGSGYLVKKEITVDTDSIPITIGQGGNAQTSGTPTAFGSYFMANAGTSGSSGRGAGISGEAGIGGHNGILGYQGAGAGWTVKSYSVTDSSGTLHKGSGAVFIWY